MPDRPTIDDTIRAVWGFDTLRPLQRESMEATLAGRDSLTVLPTGGGKSLCFQVPAIVNDSLTLVVSPLIALMQDQVAGLRLAGVPAAALHGHVSEDERASIRAQAEAGELRLLFVAPERLVTPSFLSWVKRLGVGAVAIDEAHCISQWGHDFRPEYRQLSRMRSLLPGVPIGAYTATATPRVQQDIVDQLHLKDPAIHVGSFDRPNLTYRVLPRVDLVAQVVEALSRHKDRAGIVYCISRKDTENLAASLRAGRIDAAAYHAGLDARERTRVADAFRDEKLQVVCATVAFGMGIDRGDVRCVIHAAMPKSIEHYQQETGRAGRDGLPAECVMLYSSADAAKWRQIMDRANSEAAGEPENESPDSAAALAHAFHAQLELLEQVHRFASSARCRHRSLVEYFGQAYGASECGACDVCLNELKAVDDAHDTARKIISCVARCNQGFGAGHVADVLLGSQSQRIIERGHHTLSTFGLLRHLRKEQITAYIAQLVDAGFLARSPGEYPVVTLTSDSVRVLKNEIKATLAEAHVSARPPRRARAAESPDAPLSPAESELFEALRQWRKVEAAARGVPPYVVLGDTSLEELCRVRPASLETLVCVRGIGSKKLQEFGASLLLALDDHCRRLNLALDARPGSRPRTLPDEAPVVQVKAAMATHMTGGAQLAAEHFRRGMPIDDVASAIGRARSTVAGYLAEFIEAERPESISPWVDDATRARIEDAVQSVGQDRLRPIFEHLGGEITYEQIRVVLTHKRVMAEKA